MKSNELRIGNWVIYHRNNLIDEYQKVLTVSEYAITVNEYNQDGACYPKDIAAFKPIPLTPEILEKCGATLNNWYRKEIKAKNFSFSPLDFTTTSLNKDYLIGLFFEGNACGIIIKYLHQLQNLYFALTGEELTINL